VYLTFPTSEVYRLVFALSFPSDAIVG